MLNFKELFSVNFLFWGRGGSILLGNHFTKGMSSQVRLPRVYFTPFFNYPKRKFSTISLRTKYPQKMHFLKKTRIKVVSPEIFVGIF